MESKCEDKASIQLVWLIVTRERRCSEIGEQYLSKVNMTSCRRIYSVTNVGVGQQKVPGDPADKFRPKSASATLARNGLKRNGKNR
jgi:hypothetical protein